MISGGLFVASGVVGSLYQASWEYPAMLYLDGFARVYPAFDLAVHALTTLNLTQGVVLVAIVWWLWTVKPDRDRVLLLAGVAASAAAALVSRALQIVLPTHPRPLSDPLLHILLPVHVDPAVFDNWNSFPSDHASLLFGLAATIWLVDRRAGIAACAWATLVDLGRIYEMYHFPSDIIGGAALGLFAVCIVQNRVTLAGAKWVLRLRMRAAPWFFTAAFVLSYLVATMFDDVRSLGKGTLRVLIAPHLHF